MTKTMIDRICQNCGKTFQITLGRFNYFPAVACSRTCADRKKRITCIGATNYTAKQKKLFENKIMPEPMSGCWLWTGASNRRGYGSTNFNKRRQESHRVSWRIYRGEIPDGISVLHKCDNPGCVNPDHLFLGTNSDNMKDAFRKKRGRIPHHKGEKAHSAKLTEFDVRQIRKSTNSCAEIAKEFGICQSNVSAIRRHKTWRHISD